MRFHQFLSLAVLFFISACGNKPPAQITQVKRDKTHYDKIINSSSTASKADLKKDIFLANYDYPIELAIYADGSFYYNLDNLGDGKGKWELKGGSYYIETTHKRLLFDLKVQIYTTSSEGDKFRTYFVDRFGPKELDLEIVNAL